MTGSRSALGVGVACVACVLLAPAAYAAAGRPVPSSTLFTIVDEEVLESSGLVDTDKVVFTTNDSGDDAVVYGLDPSSGRTVSTTKYAEGVEDVEALAPGREGAVWAGDIGDNRERRDDVAAYRLEPVDGNHPGTRFTLTYPDGPHDAETLLVHPVTGRVFVVSKSVFAGTVYAAPVDLVGGGEPNRMTAFARVSGLVTDGSFFPDGRHVVLRTYSTASVYTFPGFGLVGTVDLPPQPQGEGVAVSPKGRVLVSSEGVHARVLQITLPARLTDPATPSKQGPAPSTRPPRSTGARPPARSAEDWGWVALVATGIGALGYLTLRASRLRGPRRR